MPRMWFLLLRNELNQYRQKTGNIFFDNKVEVLKQQFLNPTSSPLILGLEKIYEILLANLIIPSEDDIAFYNLLHAIFISKNTPVFQRAFQTLNDSTMLNISNIKDRQQQSECYSAWSDIQSFFRSYDFNLSSQVQAEIDESETRLRGIDFDFTDFLPDATVPLDVRPVTEPLAPQQQLHPVDAEASAPQPPAPLEALENAAPQPTARLQGVEAPSTQPLSQPELVDPVPQSPTQPEALGVPVPRQPSQPIAIAPQARTVLQPPETVAGPESAVATLKTNPSKTPWWKSIGVGMILGAGAGTSIYLSIGLGFVGAAIGGFLGTIGLPLTFIGACALLVGAVIWGVNKIRENANSPKRTPYDAVPLDADAQAKRAARLAAETEKAPNPLYSQLMPRNRVTSETRAAAVTVEPTRVTPRNMTPVGAAADEELGARANADDDAPSSHHPRSGPG